ncbi:MAG: tetratricopeptide repeat protein [Verrucomicrobiota bacterium]
MTDEIQRSARRAQVGRLAGTVALTLGLLFAGGAVLHPVLRPAWERMRASQPELNPEALSESVGQGVVLGVFGGFRTLLADIAWLQAAYHWENKERPQMEALLRLATRLDPRPLYFWINAARNIAYDVPAWRIQAQGGYHAVSEAERARIWEEEAQRALRLLEEAQRFHPESARLYIEMAQVHMHRREDWEAAAKYFGKAWEAEGPYFSGRLHAEMLRRAGRPAEALAFYKDYYRETDPSEALAALPVVLERIRELEAELGGAIGLDRYVTTGKAGDSRSHFQKSAGHPLSNRCPAMCLSLSFSLVWIPGSL